MIQVYKKNELFIIENTVTDIIYPNLTREEALVLLEKFDRNEPEDRCDFAIKEDDIGFEHASLDDKDKTIAEQRKQISDLEAKLAKSEKERELDNSFWKQECDSLQKTLVEKDAELWKWATQYARAYVNRQNDLIAEKEQLKQQLEEKDKEIEKLTEELDDKNFCKDFVDLYTENKLKKQMLHENWEDKISFAIAELEKVKSAFSLINSKLDKVETIKEYIHYIDHQINELKGKVGYVKD